MLSKQQIDEHYQSQQVHFVTTNRSTQKMTDNRLQVYGLQSNNGRILGIGDFLLSVKSVLDINSTLLLTYYTRSSQYPTDYNNTIDRDKSWEWCKNSSTEKWELNSNIASYEDLDYFILMNQKVSAMDWLLTRTAFYRKLYAERSLGQDLIYTSKYLEAKDIIEKNITVDATYEYPFVSSYASLTDVPLQNAAREIILQWQIQSGFLSENENLRIKYTRKIREEKSLSNLKAILISFEEESQKYGIL